MQPDESGNTGKRSLRILSLAAGGAVIVAVITVNGSRRGGFVSQTAPATVSAEVNPRNALHRQVTPGHHSITEARKRELIATALRKLDDPDSVVRREAVANLEIYSDEILRKALGDREPAVREDAIRRLPFLKCSGNVGDCLIAASRDTDTAVVEAALDVIHEMAGAVQTEFYAAAVTSDNVATRQQAVEHLLVLENLDPQSVQIIQAGLSDSAEAVRGSALDVMKFHYAQDFKSPAQAAAWLKTQLPAN